MADNIHITGTKSGPGGGGEGPASTLENMWRKFLRSPNLQNAQIFDVLLNNQFPQATNFIPTGKQRAVRSPQADASAREFNNLRMSITQRASRDLSASRRAFQTGRPTAAAKLYERGMWGVSESGHLSELARSAGFSKAGAFRFLKTQASITGSELGGGGGVSGKQLKVLEQILSVLRKGGGGGGTGGSVSTGKNGGRGDRLSRLRKLMRGGGMLGGAEKVLGVAEDTTALGFVDPALAVAGLTAGVLKLGVSAYRGAYGMITPAMNTLTGASQISRLIGRGANSVVSPLGLAKGTHFAKSLLRWGYTPQDLLAMEGAFGVPNKQAPLKLLETLGRSKYMGGLPSVETASFIGKLVSIGSMTSGSAGKALNSIATLFGRAGVNARISIPGFMSVFQSVAGSNAPALSMRGLHDFYRSFLARGGPSARSGSMQSRAAADLERMASNPNMVQFAVGEGLLMGGVHSLSGLESNVRKFGGKGALNTLLKEFSTQPGLKKDISGSIKNGVPALAFKYTIAALRGNMKFLNNMTLSETKSLGGKAWIDPAILSSLSNMGLMTSINRLSPGKTGVAGPLKKYLPSRQGETGSALLVGAEKALVSLQLSYTALKAFGPALEDANKVMLQDFIPAINDVVDALHRFVDAPKVNPNIWGGSPVRTAQLAWGIPSQRWNPNFHPSGSK